MIPKKMSSYGISTRKIKCKKCKTVIKEGIYCTDECKEADYKIKLEKRNNRRESKFRSTQQYGLMEVYHYADRRFWSTNHQNCFRASIKKEDQERGGESEEHLDKMYERWKHHRKNGRTVFCNLILRNGMGRPDLVIVDGGDVFIEEIVKTETEASIISKREKYPFPIIIIKVEK